MCLSILHTRVCIHDEEKNVNHHHVCQTDINVMLIRNGLYTNVYIVDTGSKQTEAG